MFVFHCFFIKIVCVWFKLYGRQSQNWSLDEGRLKVRFQLI